MPTPCCDICWSGAPSPGATSRPERLQHLLATLIDARITLVDATSNTALPPARHHARRLGIVSGASLARAGEVPAAFKAGCARVALLVPGPLPSPDSPITGGWDAVLDASDVAGLARWVLGAVLAADEVGLSSEATRWRALLDHALDGMLVVDTRRGRILVANATAEELLLYARGGLVGHPLRLLFANTEGADSTVSVLASLRRVGVEHRIVELLRLDAIPVEVDLTARLFPWQGEEAILVELRDSHALAAAHGERDRYRAAMDVCPQAMVVLDARGCVQYVNPGFEQCTGFESARVVGREAHDLVRGAVDAATLDEILACVGAGRVWRGVVVARLRGDEATRYRVTAGPVHDDRGRLQGAFVTGEDVTEQSMLVEGYREAQKQEALGRLATAVAHDFNNILTVLMSNATLALDHVKALGSSPGRDGRETIEALRAIMDGSIRATELTRQLLDFSAPSAAARNAIDLVDLVRGTERFLRHLVGERIALVSTLPQERHAVRGDRSQLNQVLMNLAVNAREAMPEGGTLTLEVATARLGPQSDTPALPAGDYVRVAVADTGVGIPSAIRARIFEPFFTTRSGRGGHGMGLAIVRQIVEQHGGALTLESEVGKGSCFTLWLPSTSDAAGGLTTDQTTTPLPAGFHARVLLAEDDPHLRDLLARALRRVGHEVTDFPDGAAALQALDAGAVAEVAVIDHTMPGMGVGDLAAALRQRRPDLPIVFISGHAADDLPEPWRKASRTATLSKPFTPVQLATVIRRVVQGRRDVAT